MRLDKFLKVSRLIKRRTVANEACDAGRVTVNGKPAKASVKVKVGDIIEIPLETKDFGRIAAQAAKHVIRQGIRAGVIWQDGRPFHGDCHIRMNLALPHSLVTEAFDRLEKYVFV